MRDVVVGVAFALGLTAGSLLAFDAVGTIRRSKRISPSHPPSVILFGPLHAARGTASVRFQPRNGG